MSVIEHPSGGNPSKSVCAQGSRKRKRWKTAGFKREKEVSLSLPDLLASLGDSPVKVVAKCVAENDWTPTKED